MLQRKSVTYSEPGQQQISDLSHKTSVFWSSACVTSPPESSPSNGSDGYKINLGEPRDLVFWPLHQFTDCNRTVQS